MICSLHSFLVKTVGLTIVAAIGALNSLTIWQLPPVKFWVTSSITLMVSMAICSALVRVFFDSAGFFRGAGGGCCAALLASSALALSAFIIFATGSKIWSTGLEGEGGSVVLSGCMASSIIAVFTLRECAPSIILALVLLRDSVTFSLISAISRALKVSSSSEYFQFSLNRIEMPPVIMRRGSFPFSFTSLIVRLMPPGVIAMTCVSISTVG